MTTKEAGQKLFDILHDDSFSWTPASVEAFSVGITALANTQTRCTTQTDGIQGVGSVDCVSRQAALDALKHMCSEDRNGITVSRANVDSMLKYLPSVEPEIVRCKDCMHWHKKGDLTYCDRIEYGYGFEADDFCSRAERRTDG